MPATMKLRPVHNWYLAIRPRTLWASIAPVILGSVVAYDDGGFHLHSALTALFGALMLQTGTNLANDYFDFYNGVDTPERKGPLRVTQAGLISPQAVRLGFVLAFTLAFIACLLLAYRAGWPILLLGALSVVCGILYAGGPRPLSHSGAGDFFVLFFFGPAAVAGTYYCQTFKITPVVLVLGLASGFFSTAIMTVNNLRDILTDHKAGKRTLAVRLGEPFACHEYLFSLLSACAVPVFLCVMTGRHFWSLLSSLVIFMAIPLIYKVFTSRDSGELNAALAWTGQLLIIFTLIFAATWTL